VEHLARLDRILPFQHGEIAPEMSAGDVELCTSVEQRCVGRAQASDAGDRVKGFVVA
jgi:hypothetical protein